MSPRSRSEWKFSSRSAPLHPAVCAPTAGRRQPGCQGQASECQQHSVPSRRSSRRTHALSLMVISQVLRCCLDEAGRCGRRLQRAARRVRTLVLRAGLDRSLFIPFAGRHISLIETKALEWWQANARIAPHARSIVFNSESIWARRPVRHVVGCPGTRSTVESLKRPSSGNRATS